MDIKAKVRLLDLRGLGQIMETFYKVEDRNVVLQKFKEPIAQRGYKIHPNIHSNPASSESFPTKMVTMDERGASQ